MIPREQRLLCVSASITLIKERRKTWQDTEADAKSTGGDRARAKGQFEAAEREFGWQWRNVEVLLFEKPVEPLTPLDTLTAAVKADQ
jgi:hypothetical protein